MRTPLRTDDFDGWMGSASRKVAEARPSVDERRAKKDKAKPPSPPIRLRKWHRTFLPVLREMASEVHILHRLWYKSHAQFRHMVWWRPVQRVHKRGCDVITGSLAQSVKKARGGALYPSSASVADEPAMSVQALTSLVRLYEAFWSATPTVSWDTMPKHDTPPLETACDPVYRAAAYDAVLQWQQSLQALEEACEVCFGRLQTHLRTPPAPMHTPTCMAVMAVCARLAALCRILIKGDAETNSYSIDRLVRWLRPIE